VLAGSENLDFARNLTTRMAAAQGRSGRDGEFRVRSHENVRTTARVPGSCLARWNPSFQLFEPVLHDDDAGQG